jgi:glutamine amidotransferase
LNVPSAVSADPGRIRSASHVILPGVGAAADAMRRLRQERLHEFLPTLRQPVLGICLGMQLLFDSSDEGQTHCLGIIPGRALRFAEAPDRPVPHMGWNTLHIERDCALLAGLGPQDYAYFVHSYALPVSEATVASTRYGEPFSACVQWNNFFGAQFHPERSAAVGARLLGNFLAIH